MKMHVTACAALLAAWAMLTLPAHAAQNFVLNGSMELGPGPGGVDPHIPASWTREGSVVERSEEANFTTGGVAALKAFASEPQELAYQEIPVAGGQSVAVSCRMFTKDTDHIRGDAMAGIVLEFYNASNGLVSGPFFNFALNEASAANTWMEVAIPAHTAPGTAVKARLTCLWTWDGATGMGACFWDACSLRINGGVNQLLNPNFEEAGVGANSPTGIDHWVGFNDQRKFAGNVDVPAWHGDYVLRIGTDEAFSGLFQNMGVLSDGDRILLKARVFNATADPLLGRAGLKLEFYDPQSGNLPPPTENLAINSTSTADTWIQVPVSMDPLVVPAGATIARITLIFFGDGNPAGSVYFDSAHAELASDPGVNKLMNASFEDGKGGFNGLDNWTEFGGGGATAQKTLAMFEFPPPTALAHHGSYVVKGTGGVTGLYQGITVAAGDELSASAFLRIKATDLPSAGDVAGIKVEWFGGTIPGNVDITPGPSNSTIDSTSAQDTWIDLFIDYTMPPGTFAGVRFVAIGVPGAAYFDGAEAVAYGTIDGSDHDGDDDVDLVDVVELQRCFSGPGGGLRFNCTVFDLDEDEDVDLGDYDLFQPHLVGP